MDKKTSEMIVKMRAAQDGVLRIVENYTGDRQIMSVSRLFESRRDEGSRQMLFISVSATLRDHCVACNHCCA